MISFRYHVVSLVAVLLALAAGIVLGSGPLQERAGSLGTLTAADRSEAGSGGRAGGAAGAGELEGLRALLAHEEEFARATAPELLRGRLSGRAVTVVVLPGVRQGTVTGVVEALGLAGGTVTTQVRLGEALLDVANRQLVEELGAQVAGVAGGRSDGPAAASGYQRLGRLLARALVTTEDGGERGDRVGSRILAALASAELAAEPETSDRRGSLAVVVTGSPDRGRLEGAGAVVTALTAALDEGSDGAVLAGPPAAAEPDGAVAALREDPAAAREVSSVDVADRVSGAVATALALAEEARGRSGHYGLVGAEDGALPAVPAP